MQNSQKEHPFITNIGIVGRATVKDASNLKTHWEVIDISSINQGFNAKTSSLEKIPMTEYLIRKYYKRVEVEAE